MCFPHARSEAGFTYRIRQMQVFCAALDFPNAVSVRVAHFGRPSGTLSLSSNISDLYSPMLL